jgi:hypothetical protein
VYVNELRVGTAGIEEMAKTAREILKKHECVLVRALGSKVGKAIELVEYLKEEIKGLDQINNPKSVVTKTKHVPLSKG